MEEILTNEINDMIGDPGEVSKEGVVDDKIQEKEELEVSDTESVEEVKEDEAVNSDVSDDDSSDISDSDTTDTTNIDDSVDPFAEERAELQRLREENSRLKSFEDERELSKDVNFLEGLGDDEDYDDIVRDPSKLNSILNKVYKKGLEVARTKIIEQVTRSIPDIVKENVRINTELKSLTDKFYKDNPDLANFKPSVAAVGEEILSKHPNWSLEKVFAETGKEAKRRLKLVNVANKQTKKVTGLARPTGGINRLETKSKPDPIDLEIDSMLNSL
jgi:hypothetical protein